MKRFLRRYWHWLVVTAVFVVMVLFLSDLTLVNLLQTKRSVRRLKGEIERYSSQIEQDSVFIHSLQDDEFIEKYAREKHLMHSEGEQLFLIE